MIKVIVRPTGQFGRRGEFYEAHHDGKLLCRSIEPVFDACRALVELGVTGVADFGGRLVVDIEKGAQLCVVENRRTGPRFGSWRAFESFTE
jgi:hypothetical protein